MATKKLTVSCSCGAANHSFRVPLSALPVPSHLCMCDISRHISGSLLTSYFDFNIADTSKPNTRNLTAYNGSEILCRWFCTTCGTHMYLEYHFDGHFEAATGTLQVDQSDELIQFKSVMWIGDTKDGGAGDFITQINGQELERYSQEAGESEVIPLIRGLRSTVQTPLLANEAVHAHCHCRGVEFWITPPSDRRHAADPETTKSPFPDLLAPHHLKHEQAHNPDNVAWWSPNGTRWRAGTCTCTSCRKASGFDITFWAFIPTCNIFLDAACTRRFPVGGNYWGTMKTYTSSQGVTRTFCSKCGANVFWNGDEATFGTRGLVDVAVGLFDAPSGARAEEILDWWCGRVSFGENAMHKGLVNGLGEGLKGWEQGRTID